MRIFVYVVRVLWLLEHSIVREFRLLEHFDR